VNRGVIASLRDIVPIRPLRRTEAMSVAERQALRFLDLVGVHEPPVPERAIGELPRIEVRRATPFPVSGAADWSSGRWLIVLNGGEPIGRQRFSLAHEFKHVVDHRIVDIIYGGIPQDERAAWIEQICDYFASCILMPRPWVKRVYGSGTQRLLPLAGRFAVSQTAMRVRLNQLGLVDPGPRCVRPSTKTALRTDSEPGSSLYARSLTPAVR
jgi:hypothetical protein